MGCAARGSCHITDMDQAGDVKRTLYLPWSKLPPSRMSKHTCTYDYASTVWMCHMRKRKHVLMTCCAWWWCMQEARSASHQRVLASSSPAIPDNSSWLQVHSKTRSVVLQQIGMSQVGGWGRVRLGGTGHWSVAVREVSRALPVLM